MEVYEIYLGCHIQQNHIAAKRRKKMESGFTALFFAHTLEDEGSNQFVSEIINSMMINTILLINQISSFYHHSLSKGHIYSILKLSLWEFL